MALPVLDREKTLASLELWTNRFTGLIRSVGKPGATAIGHWSTRDVAVHTGHIYDLFPKLVSGGSSPITDHLRIGEEWDAKLKTDPEQDLGAVADAIERSAKEFANAATPEAWTEPVNWHGGLNPPVYALAGMLINEAMLHGRDIAIAEGREWKLERDGAIRSVLAVLPILPYFVVEEQARNVDAAIELQIRGGPRVYFTVENENLLIDTQPRKVDLHISADPIDYVMIGFGRKSQWASIGAGKVVAWGRKPWLALKFGKLFHSP